MISRTPSSVSFLPTLSHFWVFFLQLLANHLSARNVLFLTLLIARGTSLSHQTLWSVYYHLFLDDESAQILQEHIETLLGLSGSNSKWKEGKFGSKIRFSSSSTLHSVRALWKKYAQALASKGGEKYRADFESALKRSKEYKNGVFGSEALVYGGARAAAPLGMQAMLDGELKTALDIWWETGVTGTVPEGTTLPNPLFAASLSDNHILAFGSDPILSYHLAVARAHLSQMSPLQPTKTEDQDASDTAFIAAAKLQFSEWTKAFLDLASGSLVIRFIAADGLAFCHTLQHSLKTGDISDNFYRQQLTAERLELDPEDYTNSSAPKQFDVIDTTNLADYLGDLNLLVSAGPLLRNAPWATLYTETMRKGPDNDKQRFEELLCGPARAISTLLGLSPAEYWTNATAVSTVEEYILAVTATKTVSQQPGIQWRFSWKLNKYFSGHNPVQKLKVADSDLATLIHVVYQNMFVSEDPFSLMSLSKDRQLSAVQKQAYPKHHRGSLVAFIKRLLQCVDANVEMVCKQALKKITLDSTQVFGSNFQQSFLLEMSRQGLYTEAWLTDEIRRGTTAGPFSTWSDIPPGVAITISIPVSAWKRVCEVALQKNIGFAVEGSLRGIQGSVVRWHNLFSDVQVVFGTIKTSGERGTAGFSVSVEEDEHRWAGDSPMIATFQVPTAGLQVDPQNTKVSLCLQNSAQNISLLNAKLQLGQPMAIYETELEDIEHVYVTRNPPGQEEYPIYNNFQGETLAEVEELESKSSFTANVNFSGDISTITGHVDVLSDQGKTLLADKATVEIHKISPFVFEVVLGKRDAVYTLHFPVPVTKDGSKTRIARTSSYVEVIAPLCDPATAQTLDRFIFPSTLSDAAYSSDIGHPIPVTLNIPHMNLDSLPILDATDKKHLSFLTTLASWTFSARERKLRDEINKSAGLATSARMNFKESLFTMFMLASGLQGGQTGLFAINHPQKGGIHMLVFISALRLDGANASVVLDAAVIPFTVETIKGGQLDAFLLILRTLECCTITVDDDELVLWKEVLPALVERCRNWSHTSECKYAQPGASVPLSTEPGKQVICDCGAGKLPPNFISLPEWDTAAKFATRLAISPTYAVPFVEEIVDPNLVNDFTSSGTNIQGDETLRCRNCGETKAKAGGPLKKCMRCQKVRYCSGDCQKKDWKKHRMECN